MDSRRVLTLGLLTTLLASLFTAATFVLRAGPVLAQTTDTVCPAPIMTCGSPPEGTLVPERACPDGYRCACVPSCPACHDCAVEVCVADRPDACRPVACRTACDCAPGLGCFDGQCIAGFAPVYCCDQDPCPGAQQCQHRDGRMNRCGASCVGEVWSCGGDKPALSLRCGDGRVCTCTASCPLCEDCGPPVCVPQGTPTPWRCQADGDCGAGFRCECVSSCQGCDDCPRSVCVPDRCDDPSEPMCEERVNKMLRKTERLVRRMSLCEADAQCVHADTTTACQGTCGAWINRMYRTPFARRLARLDKRICGTYQADGCPYATPGCLAETGVCGDGRCTGSAE